jgi:glycosyltransferase involved in cell wall biosynthesis
VWVVLLVPSTLTMLSRTLAGRTAGMQPLDQWPLVSVVVAARDEGPNIERALTSMLAGDYPHLELIAVDDRSQDDTGAVMDRLAEADSRLKVIHITELPAGWLGKNHALQVGAQSASGEFLLFADGDVFFSPQAVRLAVTYAVRRGLDHLCLMPNMVTAGYAENALVAFFGMTMAAGIQPTLVPTGLKAYYVGVGAFNMVHAEAYRAAGGHEPIRFDVVDDIKLGKLMKRAGFRQDLLLAGDHVRVRWQTSAWNIIRGMEKNGFAGLDYALWKLFGGTILFCLMMIVPYVAVAFWPDVRSLGFVVSLVLMHVIYGVTSWRFAGSWLVFPVLPLAGTGIVFAFWRSAWITLRQRGVRWRGTLYPLSELRANLYR